MNHSQDVAEDRCAICGAGEQLFRCCVALVGRETPELADKGVAIVQGNQIENTINRRLTMIRSMVASVDIERCGLSLDYHRVASASEPVPQPRMLHIIHHQIVTVTEATVCSWRRLWMAGTALGLGCLQHMWQMGPLSVRS
eukprot:scaffold170034_cov23-Prasinocladus_malaysianus.AAC.1